MTTMPVNKVLKVTHHRKQSIVLSLLFVSYFFYVLNRKAVALVLPELIRFGLEKSDAGLIISAQNIAYTISKFIGGILSDQLSSRIVLGSGLLVSGLVTIVFGLFSTDSVLIFTTLWFINGFAQGFGWPACAKVLRHWSAPEFFGTLWSVISASANISGSISPFLATFITLNYGWQWTVYVFGFVSVLMSLVILICLINRPENAGFPPINPGAKEQNQTKSKNKKSSDWKDLMGSPFIWLISVSYLIVFAAKSSASDWGQIYLMQEKRQSPLTASSFTSSLELGGFLGTVLAGHLGDRIFEKSMQNGRQPIANDRLPVATVMMITVSFALHLLCFYVDHQTSPWLLSLLAGILGCSLYGPIAVFGVMASEAAPPHLSGTCYAIVALAANVGAIISGLPFSLIAEQYSWGHVFFLLECLISLNLLVLIGFGSRIKFETTFMQHQKLK